MTKSNTPPPPWHAIWSVGPAIITASVVLGPGSILSASKNGYRFGYSMTWVLVAAVVMMIGVTALSARLGVLLQETPCEELARRVGRPVAAIAGISLFLIAACFQFGNNLGATFAIEPWLSESEETAASIQTWKLVIVIGLNALVMIALFGFKKLYLPLERLMKFLVTLMIIGFAGNLLLAKPSILGIARGLVPQLPTTGNEGIDASVSITPLIAMFATTFSVAGAFYQAYLVRKKGWTEADLEKGTVDSAVGILILGCVTAMIMSTTAAVMHGNPEYSEPNSVAEVARQLEPLFGPAAKVLFCIGIFSGAFSSFLVNAMIGGTVLSDGLGLGGDIDGTWPKRFTVLTLLVGMGVAIWVILSGQGPVNLIIFAQAVTVLGIPALAISMFYLATRKDLKGGQSVPAWMKIISFVAVCISILLAGHTAYTRFF